MNRDSIKPFVIGLLVVQTAISASLWVLNSISVTSTAAFALLLAADVLVFAAVCNIYFTEDQEDAEIRMFGAVAVPAELRTHETSPPPRTPIFDTPPVTSRRLRIAVPILSLLILITLATLVASGSGTTKIFIPIFLGMVIVYVFASIYLFKMIIEKEKQSTGDGVPPNQDTHEDH